ncbi:MAG: hypothetical protein WBR56_04545 [Sedimenticolaceae bacterium]
MLIGSSIGWLPRQVRYLAAALLIGLPGLAIATTTINHRFSPATIDPGDTPTYTIEIANDSLVPLTAAAVTSILPPQITIADPANITDTCGFGSVTANPGSSDVILSGGTIPAGDGFIDGQCFFEIPVTSIVPGNHVATIPANTTPDATTSGYTALENGIAVFNGTPALATLAVGTLQNPTGSKTFSPSPAVAGDSSRLSIVLSNPNNSTTLPLTIFTDNLPAGMVVASPANGSVACTGAGAANGTVTAVPGGVAVTLDGGIIGEAGSCTVAVDVVVPSISGTTESFTNSVPADAIGNTRGLTSAAFSRNLNVNTPIGVSKSFVPDTIPAGQPALLTIVIANNSTQNTLPITQFIDDLTTTTLSILDSANGAPADPAVICDGTGAADGALTDGVGGLLDQGDTEIRLAGAVAGVRSGANGKCTITAYVTSTTDGAHTNTIPANAVDNPAGYASPAASDSLLLNAQLTVDKTVSVNQVAPGQSTQFTVTINNWSGADVTNVSFRDTLPNAGGIQMVLDDDPSIPVSSVGCIGGTFSGSDGDAALDWTGGTIPAGSGALPGVCTIVFRARLPATATTGLVFSNQIPSWDGVNGVGGDGNGPGGSVVNPGPSPAVNVATVDAVAVTKDFIPGAVAQGQTATLRLRVRNRVQSSLTTVDLTDTLPAGLTLAANPAATNSCGGSLQAFPGDTQVVLTGGIVNPRPDNAVQTTCAITVQVTGDMPGAYTNSIDPADFSSSAGTIAAPVSDVLTITAGITASKTFLPAMVATGGRSRLTVNLVNNSSGALTNVAVDDSGLSAGLSVANPANAASSCGGTTSIVANPGATNAQLLGVTLPAGANCDFSFDVTTSGPGPWGNTIPPGGITSAEGATNSSPVSANLTAMTADIGINKSFNPIIVTGGQPSLLTIDVINSSSATINDVAFTDVFPEGIVVYPVPDASTNCQGGTVTAMPGDASVGMVGATLLPNDTCQVFVTTTSIRYLNLTNFIPAGVITSAQGFTNALGTQASLSTLQGLGLTKGFAPAYIPPGATARLILQLISTFDPNAVSPVTITGMSFTDPLPAGLVFAPVPNASTTCPGATLTVNTGTQALTISGGSLLPGTQCLIEVDVTAPAVGVYENLIAEEAITTDQGVTNQTPAAADLHVIQEPTLAKSFAPTTVGIGQRTTLTVTVTNNSDQELTGLSLTDTLPVGLAVFAAPDATTTCAGGAVSAVAGDNEIDLSGATVPANGSCSFQADVVASGVGSLTNTIGADAIETDQGISNPAPVNAALQVLAPPTLSKAFSPAAIAAADTSRLTLSLGNPNAVDVSLVSALVDALPGNVFVAATPNVVTSCPGAVTASPGANQFSYANGGVIPPGGCTISVDVTSNVAGSYTNTIASGQLATSAGDNPEPAVATLGVGGVAAAPTIAKAFSPSTIDEGGVSTLSLSLGNPNTTLLTLNADFTDSLPTNLVIASPPNAGLDCVGGTLTAIAGSVSLTYSLGGQIPPGGCTISVSVTSATAGSYNNSVPVGALSTTEGGVNPRAATAGLAVVAPVPPTLLKSITPNVVNPGGIARLTLTLGNDNAQAATLSVDLVDNLPVELQVAGTPNLVSSCPGAVSNTASSITYAAGSIIPSGGCSIAVDVTSSVSGGPWVNSLGVAALQTDLGDNGAPTDAGLSGNPPQPPSVSKQFVPDTIPDAGISTLSIAFGNGNAAAATLTADLVDTLPANVVVAAVPNIQASTGCDPASVLAPAGGNSVTYLAGGTIPANGGCSIAVDVTSTVLGTYPNLIPVGALQTTIGSNNTATQDSLTVSPIPPTVTKAFSPSNILPEGIATLSIGLGNSNGVAATLSSALVDNLPAGVTVATDPDIKASAGCNAGDVVAAAGGTTVTYRAGAGIPVGGCTLSVNVTATAIDTYMNEIPAGALVTNLGSNAAPSSDVLRVGARPPVQIPVMPHWGLALLVGLLISIAWTQLARRNH